MQSVSYSRYQLMFTPISPVPDVSVVALFNAAGSMDLPANVEGGTTHG